MSTPADTLRRMASRIINKRRVDAWKRDQILHAADVPACMRFNADGLNWDAHDFVHWLTTPGVRGKVAVTTEGEIAAFIVYELCECGAIHIRNLATNPELRRRGHARQLLNDVMFREGWRTVTADVCEVDRVACEYFKSQGFDAHPLEKETTLRDGVLRDVWRFRFDPDTDKPTAA